MNKLGKLLAAVVISGLSSVSLAQSRFHALEGEVRLGDNLAQGHLRSQSLFIPGLTEVPAGSRVVIQFNVRSSNKSPYNGIYLAPYFDTIDVAGDPGEFCDPVLGDPADEPDLVAFLPYSAHREVHNGVPWPNGWRSVHAVIRKPAHLDGQPVGLLICSRDKDGDVVGDLDDFVIKDLVIHYQDSEVFPFCNNPIVQ